MTLTALRMKARFPATASITTRHTDDLKAIDKGGSGGFKENRKWGKDSRLPLVFAPAERTGGLTPLEGKSAKSTLLKKSSREPLSDDFI